jgi:hypothetical protein
VKEGRTVTLDLPLVANVTEAGDIVLYAMVLGATLVVGLALLGMDAAVRRLGRRRARRRPLVDVGADDRAARQDEASG